MKLLLLTLLLCASGKLYSQVEIPENRNYRYSSDQENYFFLLESSTDQSLQFDTVDGSEKCFVQILNNTQDTLILMRAGSRNHPLYWFYDKGLRSRDTIFPMDTIHMKAKFAQRHGQFRRPIKVEHLRNSEEIKAFFSIPVSGFFKDAALLKQLKDRAIEKEKPKKQNYTYTGPYEYVLNENPAHDSIPIRIDYYTDGTVRYKRYKREGVVFEEFTRQGRLKKSSHKDGTFTTFFENGNPKYTRGLDRYSTVEPYETFYFTNGCLKEKHYNQSSLTKKYDSLNCGKLLQTALVDSLIEGNTITYFNKGTITRIAYFRDMKYSDRVEYKGTFSEGKLMNGTVTYYGYKNHLLFESQIINGERNNVLSSGEKQGNQINLKDPQGRKTGLWITRKKDNATFPVSSLPLKETVSSTADFSEDNYVFSTGDTIARVKFHYTGNQKSYLWIKNQEQRVRLGKPIEVSYHENGFVHVKNYALETGLYASVNYSEAIEGQIIGGNRGGGKMTFKDNQLVEVYTIKYPPARPDNASGSVVDRNKKYACRAKGTFRNFELYNGFFYYYQGEDNLILTEKVTNGVIQYNPRVSLRSPQLESIARRHDLNFNGRIEQRELNDVTKMHFHLDSVGIEKFPFNELYKFQKLESLVVNSLRYKLSDYASKTALKAAIHKRSGATIPKPRRSWEPPSPIPLPPPEHIDLVEAPQEEIVEFPDVEAEFPGGMTALFQFIQANLKLPNEAHGNLPNQGRVFVSFVVEKDGSITNVKILKGVSAAHDSEAKRVVNSMPKWTPAESQGQKCRSRPMLPIDFRLK